MNPGPEPRTRVLPSLLRQRLHRMTHLRLIAEWDVPPGGTALTIITTGGDTWTGPERTVHAYLDGLAHGSWAVRRKAE